MAHAYGTYARGSRPQLTRHTSETNSMTRFRQGSAAWWCGVSASRAGARSRVPGRAGRRARAGPLHPTRRRRDDRDVNQRRSPYGSTAGRRRSMSSHELDAGEDLTPAAHDAAADLGLGLRLGLR